MKVLLFLAFGLLLLGCTSDANQQAAQPSPVAIAPPTGLIVQSAEKVGKVFSLDESKAVALAFAKTDETFLTDGVAFEEKGFEALSCRDCFAFFFQFTSRHMGYGNRTGRIMSRALTLHKMRVEVGGGVVSSAVIDGKWDALKEELLG